MKSFRILTAAALAAAIVPRLAQRGMFVDGVTYASIARNLSEGRGSFWSPSYTATVYPQFHEHPPFGFWLQSWWFRVLGDHLFVERAYSLAAAIGTALLIALIWRRLNAASAEGPAAAVTEDPAQLIRTCRSRRTSIGCRFCSGSWFRSSRGRLSATCSK